MFFRSPSFEFPSFPEYEVHIWLIHFPAFLSDMNLLFDALSPAEKHKAQQFHFQKDQHAYIISHGAVRWILSHYLNVSPAQIIFGTEDHGKPVILEPSMPALHFNLSHSGSRALLAVSHHPVGIDIEQIKPDFNFTELVSHIMSPPEQQCFMKLPKEKQRDHFFLLWTRKEAYIKAIGKGLSYPLKKLTISLDWNNPKIQEDQAYPEEYKRWQMIHVDVGPDYVGTLTCSQKSRAIRYYLFESYLFQPNQFTMKSGETP
ncbi:4'-phosphopantetheinyl transferase family protein [Thermoflavimicrobium dichotomicum]|uniref:4'-phosphopantetheinyl transferase n=1 Tax=Thermoflavimicrobium dichotomicum TaxID=46223 RepID=A0A1I3T3U2_9BACL|nr:4'-phosphopantetheinyl transferase superfamily protein [Thermoflavimicrobium dichotomicum]SFJ64521.1 4'-phosphopantetheinyl transferase [Thermoflavimicrobium dichotomicum]